MSRRNALLALLVVCAAGAIAARFYFAAPQQAQGRRTQPVAMPAATSFRILLGVGDTAPTNWDGSVTVSGGRVLSIQGWRFSGDDSTDYKASWKASTRYSGPQTAAARKAGGRGVLLENGVVVAAALESATAEFQVRTRQGEFRFKAQDLPHGDAQAFLDGRVSVDRVPSTLQLTQSDEEQDFPAAAMDGDDIWVAYVEFTHGDRAQARGNFTTPPNDLSFLARPVGGDRVRLMRYSKSRNVWDTAIDVSEPKQDIVRAAVAVDGRKRVWVVWSANRQGNFDLFARVLDKGKWSDVQRVTRDPGTDLNPVAATDAKGRVWIAWQGWRRDSLDVLAAVQQGDRFGSETVVSASPGSDWDPAIAASANGEVAVSWDTYDKGDYDVYARRLRADREIAMDAPAPIAASRNFEARSSIAYDARNRLWVAYEASEVKWGKDFGAYETTGVALYQGHTLKVRVLDGAKLFETADDLGDALPGAPAAQQRRRRRAADQAALPAPASLELPNPRLAGQRPPSGTPQPPPLPMNSFPRIAVDSEGAVYLAFRTPGGAWRSPVGTVWFANVMRFDGTHWRGPVFVPRTDHLLDNRPALVAASPGHLVMVSAMDHRQSQAPGGGRRGDSGINTDLYAADLRFDDKPQPARLKALPRESPAPPDPDVKPEVEQVALMRQYRAAVGGDKLQLLRGEFHRHTEMSGDGGRDGPVIDAYRYMIDAAYMDWVGCCDHDNGGGREYFWWLQQKLTDAYHLGTKFVPMFSYERSVRYPEGHRNLVMARRGVRPLPRLPKMADDSPPTPAPDTQLLYRYLREFGGIAAVHTSGTDMGTDWRDNDPKLEPAVEIYQGDRQNYETPDAPRSNNAKDSIGGWRPLGFVSLALQKGYRLGFQASSDHISTHMSYCNLWVTAPTREGVMEAFRKRRLYGATDNILADVRCAGHFMGEEFSLNEAPEIQVKLQGTAPFAKVHIIRDNQYVYTIEPKTAKVEFAWRDNAPLKGRTAYYYVRGEQQDGELVWVSPMWIKVE